MIRSITYWPDNIVSDKSSDHSIICYSYDSINKKSGNNRFLESFQSSSGVHWKLYAGDSPGNQRLPSHLHFDQVLAASSFLDKNIMLMTHSSNSNKIQQVLTPTCRPSSKIEKNYEFGSVGEKMAPRVLHKTVNPKALISYQLFWVSKNKCERFQKPEKQ